MIQEEIIQLWQNAEKQIVPCESRAGEVSFEWSHQSINFCLQTRKLGPVQASHFSCAEFNTNEENLLFLHTVFALDLAHEKYDV